MYCFEIYFDPPVLRPELDDTKQTPCKYTLLNEHWFRT